MTRQVLVADRDKAVLRALPPDTRRRLKQALATLAEDLTGKASGLDVRALDVPQAAAPIFRLAVGSFRIVFSRQRRAIQVLRIFHRSEGYAWLENA